eukprot:350822_1
MTVLFTIFFTQSESYIDTAYKYYGSEYDAKYINHTFMNQSTWNGPNVIQYETVTVHQPTVHPTAPSQRNKNKMILLYEENEIFNHCISTMENIHILPSWNDPDTKQIRSSVLQHAVPPYLISFGGSGNTFIRLLIEYITKIYTGTVYKWGRDWNKVWEYKKEKFTGSRYCGTEVIVTKFHGDHMMVEGRDFDYIGHILKGQCLCGCYRWKPNNKSVSNVNITRFEAMNGKIIPSAIFIIRDPWKAMFALYNYVHGHNKPSALHHKNHIALRSLSRAKVVEMRTTFAKYAVDWNYNVQVLNAFKDSNASHLVIKFEDITHVNHAIGTKQLVKMTQYLYRAKYYMQNEAVFKYRMHCVWKIMSSDARMNWIHREKPNVNQLNITYAYQLIGTQEICSIWSILKPYALRYGYSIYNNISCTF